MRVSLHAGKNPVDHSACSNRDNMLLVLTCTFGRQKISKIATNNKAKGKEKGKGNGYTNLHAVMEPKYAQKYLLIFESIF